MGRLVDWYASPPVAFVLDRWNRKHGPGGRLAARARIELWRGRGWRWRIRRLAFRLVSPTPSSLLGSFVLFAIVASLTLLLGGSDLRSSRQLSGGLETMWQVQAALAALALPLLGLIIQLAGEQGQTAARTHEVLTRQSWIFPISCLALFGTLFVGGLLVWSRSTLGATTGGGWLTLTVVMALLAYYRSLRTLNDPLLMRRLATKLLQERMQNSLDYSAALRVANNRLLAALSSRQATYFPYVARSDRRRWLVLEGPPDMVVSDVRLGRLLRFIDSLPRIAPLATSEPQASESVAASRADEPIRLLKVPGDRLLLNDRGVLALRLDAFAPIKRESLGSLLLAAFDFETGL